MNYEQIRDEIEKIVKKAAREEKVWEYTAWTHHIMIVRKFGIEMAKERGADVEIVELAALLHDYSSLLDKKYYKEHNISSAEMARELLAERNYPDKKITQVEAAILSHRGSVVKEKNALEQIIIADADAMAHFAVVYDLLHLAYVTKGLKTEEGKKFVLGKLERSYNKMSDYAQKKVEAKYHNIKEALKRGI